jgi:hypothetical protein
MPVIFEVLVVGFSVTVSSQLIYPRLLGCAALSPNWSFLSSARMRCGRPVLLRRTRYAAISLELLRFKRF